MLDSGFMPPYIWARVIETTKVVDVLLLLGRTKRCFIQG